MLVEQLIRETLELQGFASNPLSRRVPNSLSLLFRTFAAILAVGCVYPCYFDDGVRS
jgi:hypothetical protein